MSEGEHVLEYRVKDPLGNLRWLAKCSCGWVGETPGIKMLDSARLRLLVQHHAEIAEPNPEVEESGLAAPEEVVRD
jgi:hypothetical protein